MPTPTTASPQDATESRTPNVLIYFIDELRADALGCHGHPFVKTPGDRPHRGAGELERAVEVGTGALRLNESGVRSQDSRFVPRRPNPAWPCSRFPTAWRNGVDGH